MMLYIYYHTPTACILDSFADCENIHDVTLICGVADEAQRAHKIDGRGYRRYVVVNENRDVIHKSFIRKRR